MSAAKVALVSGASRGIGRSVALQLAARGYTVAVGFRAREEAAAEVVSEVTSHGGSALALGFDVSDASAVARAFETLDGGPGAPEVLVCSAGVTRDGLLATGTPEDLTALVETNLAGVVSCCREASRRMVRKRRGAIVTVSSVAAQKPGRGQSHYAATKGAVESFTRALAVELAPRSIRVNCVAPGIVETEMTAGIRALAPDAVTERVLLRRMGHPDEIARVITFLATDDASYVTGQVWSVDGGFKLE